MARTSVVTSLCGEIERVLRPLLSPGGGVALLDFPRYANVGDSAIWLGQLRCLRTLGMGPPVVTCAHDVASLDRLATRIGRRPILLSGGGNLGDLWPRHQEFRERVITAFPNNRIVQLPQTIHFTEETALDRARDVFNRHSNLTLLVRDRPSLDLATSAFQVDVRLCPDMAFYLGPLRRAGPAAEPVVTLLRRDSESAVETGPSDAVDWAAEPRSLFVSCEQVLARQLRVRPRSELVLRRPWAAVSTEVARARVRRGVQVLSRGQTVVTDRLHGHILSLLLGIPHFVVGDRYGKMRGFYDAWTRDAPLATWCTSADDAREKAAAGMAEMGRDD